MIQPYELLLILLGYLFFTLTSANKTGDNNKFDVWISELIQTEIDTSLRYKINVYSGEIHIHIHHWCIMTFMYILFYYFQFEYLTLFCIGGILQGILCYDDWFKVISFSDYRCEDFSISE